MTPYGILWGATWGNNVAAIEWVAAVAVATALLRKPITRLLTWAKGKLLAEVHEHSAQARAAAEAALEIAADTHKHLTGETHPAAPKSGDG